MSNSGPNRRITDDDFAAFFANDSWNGIDKLFILDACYSGGFWNTDTSRGDSGDFTSLQRSALFAAATESNYSWNANLFGDDELYGVLGVAIQDILADEALGGIVQFESLIALVQQRYNQFMTWIINGQQIQGNPGLGDTFNNNITSLFVSAFDETNGGAVLDPTQVNLESLVLAKTDDFELTLGVPEPTTIAMTACAAVLLLGVASGRSRM